MPDTTPHTADDPLILGAIAADEHAAEVVAVARHLASEGGYRVLFAHVAAHPVPSRPSYGVMPGPGFGPHLTAGAMDELRLQAVESGVRLFESLGVDSEPERHLAFGDPVTELSALAAEHRPALVVTGSRGRGPLAGAVLGSVSRSLVTELGRPVLVARDAQAFAAGGPIVCGVDLPVGDARTVVRTVVPLARRLGRTLTVVHVVEEQPAVALHGAAAMPVGAATPEQEQAEGRELLDALRPLLAQEVEAGLVMVGGRPAGRLAGLAESADASLLVVGSRGLGAVRSVLDGSVSLDLIRDHARSVLVVPTSGGWAEDPPAP